MRKIAKRCIPKGNGDRLKSGMRKRAEGRKPRQSDAEGRFLHKIQSHVRKRLARLGVAAKNVVLTKSGGGGRIAAGGAEPQTKARLTYPPPGGGQDA